MSTAVAPLTRPSDAAIENVMARGDLAALTPADRVTYLRRLCESLGLNPWTRPFSFLTLSGKVVCYATKDATEQLRKLHGVSITDLQTQRLDDVFVVSAKALDREGRTDMATGAVPIGSLKGEALANALMKAETKAKRRVTLSICGLGILDESEIETIPGAVVDEGPKAVPRVFAAARVTKVEKRSHGPVSWADVTFTGVDANGEEWTLTLPTAADVKDAAVSAFEGLTPAEPVTLTTDVGPRNGKERICKLTREQKTAAPPAEPVIDADLSDVGF